MLETKERLWIEKDGDEQVNTLLIAPTARVATANPWIVAAWKQQHQIMIPSTNINGNEPIISWPFFNDITTQSKEDNHFPLFLINFPTSPIVHYNLKDYDDDTFLQNYNDLHHQQPFMEYSSAAAASMDMMEGSNRTGPNDESAENPLTETNKGQTEHIVKKKSPKSDRHSKINTAQGPRYRRMRLSLEVARKFFDLQDMLGFDKASRTIEWLLFQSKSAIVELVKSLPNNGAAYACTAATEQELLSEFDEMNMISNGELQKNGASKKTPPRCSRKEKKARYPCKLVARESRKKARERARERTMEKSLIRRLGRSEPGGEAMKIFLNSRQQQQARARDLPSAEVLAENEKFKSSEQQNLLEMAAKQVIDDDFLEVMCKWSHDTGIFQEHQSRDLQLFHKP